jgi:hypothetical protein
MSIPSTIASSYLEHLTDGDLALLVERGSAHEARVQPRSFFRSRPGRLEELLAAPQVFETIFSDSPEGFSGGPEGDPLLAASPFLVFAVCVQRAAIELASVNYVAERLGPGLRAPVFDTSHLRDFLSTPLRRLFLVELLASYTHVSSGSVVVLTRRGLRRQRFSELDPVKLAGMLEVVSDSERPGIFRRLGDLALFLTGVFPDHVERRGFGPIEEGRLLRSVGRGGGGSETLFGPRGPVATGDAGAGALLEQLGRRWYGVAYELLPKPAPESASVLGELPERFAQARRILGFITERFLFAHRDRWFGRGGG